MSKLLRRVLSRSYARAVRPWPIICLGQLLPASSCAHLGSASSVIPRSELAPDRVCRVSLRQLRPLYAKADALGRPRPLREPSLPASSLWHWSSGHPGWPLATILLFGARTFLCRLGGICSGTEPNARLY